MFVKNAYRIFEESVNQYHQYDDIDRAPDNPYAAGSIEHLLFAKNWIDTVQWHLEDIIRDPDIDPVAALALKRRIDASNQDRTDMVEYIDSWFLENNKDVTPQPDATINTETPAWAFDRLSILSLKIYHMMEEASRKDASPEHIQKCREKCDVLLMQKEDLTAGIQQLLDDIGAGKKYMKVYKQMKMYNDPSLNPVLYSGKK